LSIYYDVAGWKILDWFVDSPYAQELTENKTGDLRQAVDKVKMLDKFSRSDWRHGRFPKLLTLCHMDLYNQNMFFEVRIHQVSSRNSENENQSIKETEVFSGFDCADSCNRYLNMCQKKVRVGTGQYIMWI
jgi:hypothetical protein